MFDFQYCWKYVVARAKPEATCSREKLFRSDMIGIYNRVNSQHYTAEDSTSHK